MHRYLVVVLSLFTLTAFAQDRAQDRADGRKVDALIPALVDMPPSQVFTPLGFDDNDNAQLVVDGTLTNTCYKIGPTQVKVDDDLRKIFVRQTAYYYSGAWCADVRVPYVQTVDLGILKAGVYDIIVLGRENARVPVSTLPIGVAKSDSADEFLYAPVSNARLEKQNGFDMSRDAAYALLLSGTFGNSCMSLKEVKTNIRAGNVIEVLPIADLDDKTQCAPVVEDFQANVSLRGVPHGRYLLHIRSLNGQSINKVVDL